VAKWKSRFPERIAAPGGLAPDQLAGVLAISITTQMPITGSGGLSLKIQGKVKRGLWKKRVKM